MQSSARAVAKACKALSKESLRKLLKASPAITNTTFERYSDFDKQESYVAGLMFAGVAFKSLSAGSFGEEEWVSFSKRVVVLSALYGFCRPLDIVKPYRLDLADRLAVEKQKDLYAFWKNQALTLRLMESAKEAGANAILNCASAEYAKAIDRQVVEEQGMRVIDCVFKSASGSNLPSVRAKQARGLFARHVVQTEAETVEALKSFNGLELGFDKEASDDTTLVFRQGIRSKPSASTSSSKKQKRKRKRK